MKQWKFVYVGRLVKYKRIDSIIKVLADISNIDWELDIIGEGSEKEYLTELAARLHQSNRINFCGCLPRDEVMNKMKDAHCFIMVSKNEIFGLVYLEAMAASCITIMLIAVIISYVVCKHLGNTILWIAIRAVISTFIAMLCVLIFNWKNDALSQIMQRFIKPFFKIK